jgi:hypothetical protein
MKPFIFMAVLVLAMAGCGGSQPAGNPYGEIIRDWQAREALCPPVVVTGIEDGRGASLTLRQLTRGLLMMLHQRQAETPADPGRVSAWQTSAETLARGRGVCRDVAILAQRAIRDTGLEEKHGLDARLRILDMGRGVDPHMIVIVYTADPAETYEISNLDVSRGESNHPVVSEFDESTIYF